LDVYGTVTGSVYVYGTVTGSVYVSGTAKVGSVYVYGTVTGSLDVYGTVTGSLDEQKDLLRKKKIAEFTFEEIEADHRKILAAAPDEVAGLLAAIRAGKINGKLYDGECRCLVGTLEKIRGCEMNEVVLRNQYRPAEKFYMAIGQGHTPKNNSFSRYAEQWCVEFLAEKGASK
jgi:hypothetical protein